MQTSQLHDHQQLTPRNMPLPGVVSARYRGAVDRVDLDTAFMRVTG